MPELPGSGRTEANGLAGVGSQVRTGAKLVHAPLDFDVHGTYHGSGTVVDAPIQNYELEIGQCALTCQHTLTRITCGCKVNRWYGGRKMRWARH